jgi:TetR/AcrR family transcriptional repressor of nem operon
VVTDSKPATRPGKRERLVTAARELVHRQGVARTTLADIAHAADVPPGNVYYYFKTKDEIVAAVVATHVDRLVDAFAELERSHPDPAARLVAFVGLEADWAAAAPPEQGCPYGTISTELARQADAPAGLAATLLQLQLDWVEQQFRATGRAGPRDLALRLLAAWQGGAVLTSALGDPAVMADQARRIQEWITSPDPSRSV